MTRRCEVLRTGGVWREVSDVVRVRRGDVFRLFEADGTPVVDADGSRTWRALADAFTGPDGKPLVDTETVPESEVERQVRTSGVFWPSGSAGSGSRLRS